MQIWIGLSVLAATVAVGYIFLSPKKQKRNPNSKKLKVAVIGMGGIGTAHAFEFAKAGNNVTAIARGDRFEQLKKEKSITTEKGVKVDLEDVHSQLDTSIEYDAVIVSVLAHQLDTILPQLKISKAKDFLFTMNIFEKREKLDGWLGKERVSIGFPFLSARVNPTNAKLVHEVFPVYLVSTVDEKRWEQRLNENGIPAAAIDDMDSWMRSHAAFACSLLMSANLALSRKSSTGISMKEANLLALAMFESLNIVEQLGHQVRPWMMNVARHLPTFFTGGFFWLLAKGTASMSIPENWNEPRELYAVIKREYGKPTPVIDQVLKLIPTNNYLSSLGFNQNIPASNQIEAILFSETLEDAGTKFRKIVETTILPPEFRSKVWKVLLDLTPPLKDEETLEILAKQRGEKYSELKRYSSTIFRRSLEEKCPPNFWTIRRTPIVTSILSICLMKHFYFNEPQLKYLAFSNARANLDEAIIETGETDVEELTKIIQTFAQVCHNEEVDTYCCLERFLELPEREYGGVDVFCNRQIVMLTRLLQLKETAIFNHFTDIQFRIEEVSAPWFQTYFANLLPADTLACVYEKMLGVSFDVCCCVAVVLISYSKASIIQTKSASQITSILNKKSTIGASILVTKAMHLFSAIAH